MKKLSIITTFLICLAFAGCGTNKDADVGAFISETDKLASDIVKTVNANPSQTGLDQAQKMLDAKKTELKNKCNSIKKLRGFELSKEMTDKLPIRSPTTSAKSATCKSITPKRRSKTPNSLKN
jgi:hypothetical protein